MSAAASATIEVDNAGVGDGGPVQKSDVAGALNRVAIGPIPGGPSTTVLRTFEWVVPV